MIDSVNENTGNHSSNTPINPSSSNTNDNANDNTSDNTSSHNIDPTLNEDTNIIPHITQNIFPYSSILSNLSIQSYNSLFQLIKSLSLSNNTSSLSFGSTTNIENKKKFLALLIHLKRLFIKSYVLNKWLEISLSSIKLIDLLNWLRSLNCNFDFLLSNLKQIKLNLNNAKLPMEDLITSFITLSINNNNINILNINALINNNLRLNNLSLLNTNNLFNYPLLSNSFIHSYLSNISSLLNLKLSSLFNTTTTTTNNLSSIPSINSINSPSFISSIHINTSLTKSLILKNYKIENAKLYISIKNHFNLILTLKDNHNIKTKINPLPKTLFLNL
ncbi:uncharacterized protein ASCRUDRAFT_87626 [Ascoidea rubescens DSM 1968]|uniref:Mediator of RNA polymerase II transcription subunit 14 n=1 Tax=Ascoidea rubescens DSM 1968 TaxID=1344418 RepID=A0A1D2VC11_9ASCO|nr:hypothetical protein ASCRUDRAFT_87626 [Ascoidea rubescens DSM 1968]ODV59176.1 hypothetical protein ASCRUDRAFT_87626 [Ascoidea rubescens DSM 1968]